MPNIKQSLLRAVKQIADSPKKQLQIIRALNIELLKEISKLSKQNASKKISSLKKKLINNKSK